MKHLLGLSFFALSASPAFAQITVIGPGEAQSCYEATKRGDRGTQDALDICESALRTPLNTKDRAATHVNLGILLMRSENYTASKAEYETALDIRPDLAEAYINYGAVLIYSGDIEESITALTTAIELETSKLPEALYNRALAFDRQENYTSAYKDLKRALELRPDWDVALKAINRYDVKQRS